jgi:hypothetical protein
MKLAILRGFLYVGLTALALGALIACDEDEPNTDLLDSYFEQNPFVSDPREDPLRLVKITPAFATINVVGGRAVFRANGGSGSYTWDVSNPAMGAMSPASGDTSTYTALGIGANDVIVYDGHGDAAIAAISGTVPGDFYVSASANPTTLNNDNDLSVLTASGGTPVYTWSVSEPGKGGFPNGNTGKSVLYKRLAPGDNGITVTDGRGSTASLVITQP